jgi:ADP-ribose pyrophosphatase
MTARPDHDPARPSERRRVFQARRFYVEHRVYERAEGEPIVRDIVVHPGAVVILPVLDKHRIVMIRSVRHAVGQELMELPAGTLEPGEQPIETARRELAEETGYEAGRIEPLIEFYTSPGVLSELMRAYTAHDLTFVGQRLEDSERIVPEIVMLEDARCGLIEGRFRDGKTIAVLGTYFSRFSNAVACTET